MEQYDIGLHTIQQYSELSGLNDAVFNKTKGHKDCEQYPIISLMITLI
jgi:hypothetical protein